MHSLETPLNINERTSGGTMSMSRRTQMSARLRAFGLSGFRAFGLSGFRAFGLRVPAVWLHRHMNSTRILTTLEAHAYKDRLVIITQGEPSDEDWDEVINYYGFQQGNITWHVHDDGRECFIIDKDKTLTTPTHLEGNNDNTPTTDRTFTPVVLVINLMVGLWGTLQTGTSTQRSTI